MNINKNINTIIDYETGDGFRTLALPSLVTPDSLVISNNIMIQQYYKDKNAITIQKLNKIINEKDFSRYKLIFVDCRVPRNTSKAYKALMKLCRGKQIVLISKPHDVTSLCDTMGLISVTKNVKLKSITFNYYMFSRGRW